MTRVIATTHAHYFTDEAQFTQFVRDIGMTVPYGTNYIRRLESFLPMIENITKKSIVQGPTPINDRPYKKYNLDRFGVKTGTNAPDIQEAIRKMVKNTIERERSRYREERETRGRFYTVVSNTSIAIYRTEGKTLVGILKTQQKDLVNTAVNNLIGSYNIHESIATIRRLCIGDNLTDRDLVEFIISVIRPVVVGHMIDV